jgi:ribosome-associated translation inhibitor RaiA
VIFQKGEQMMFIDTRAMGFPLTEAIQAHMEMRIEKALGSASPYISRVTARVEDVNAARGGVDKRCQIVVFVNGHEPVVAEVVRTDLYRAIDAAANRIRAGVVRQLRRRLSLSRKLSSRALQPAL